MSKLIMIIFIITLLTPPLLADKAPRNDQESMTAFIDHMMRCYHFNKVKLTALLSSQKANQTVLKHIRHPYEAQPWSVYYTHFITPQRVAKGLSYWKKYHSSLARAQTIYGVPAAMIVAIIGIESNYGHFMQPFKELNTLTTLAFHYPPRARFFQQQLQAYLLMTREQNINPRKLRGSYAGAFGIPQFMPSSYRQYAIDFAHQGSINLLTNHIDAIGCIAYYLKKQGFSRNQPIAVKVSVQGQRYRSILYQNGALVFKQTVADIQSYDVKIPNQMNHSLKAALIVVGKKQPEFYIIFPNFKALMSYNPRINYALVAYKLSQKLKRKHDSIAV